MHCDWCKSLDISLILALITHTNIGFTYRLGSASNDLKCRVRGVFLCKCVYYGDIMFCMILCSGCITCSQDVLSRQSSRWTIFSLTVSLLVGRRPRRVRLGHSPSSLRWHIIILRDVKRLPNRKWFHRCLTLTTVFIRHRNPENNQRHMVLRILHSGI